MIKDIFIGCDIGTSGAKAVAVSSDGTVLADSHKGYGLITPHPQWTEQWPDVWLDAAAYTIKNVVDMVDSQRIGSVCISALYGGTGVMCDEKMNALRPTIIWMDRRADEESKYIENTIGRDKIFSISGNGIDSYFGFTKLLWVKNHEPQVFSKINSILPVHSYIVYKMTGKITSDYCSCGNIGGIYDYNSHGWSSEIAEILGIKVNTLPHVMGKPTDIAGYLNKEYTQKLGISSDVPICYGTVDCVASMLSAGIVGEGDNAAVLGTSLNWGYIRSDKPDNPDLISMPYCINPQQMSYTYGGASTAGALPRWFMQQFMQNESSETYKELEKKVQNTIPPGSEGLIILPYFMGERTPVWDENASGTMVGLSLLHTKEHIYRAILESTAYALRHIMESMADVKNISKIILVGGGSKSALWRQIFADVTGIDIYTPKNPVEAPLGDAFMAAMSVGQVKRPDEIHSWIEFNEPVKPDINVHQKYNEYFEVYKSLYPELKDSMARLKKLSF